MTVLYKECVDFLGSDCEILSDEKSKEIVSVFSNTFPITEWGRIDWKLMKNVRDIQNIEDIHFDVNCFIIWDNSEFPVLYVAFKKVKEFFYDVKAVSFDTWLFFKENDFVIELFHDDKVTSGYAYTTNVVS